MDLSGRLKKMYGAPQNIMEFHVDVVARLV
jgi:hypothetical protein